MMGNVQLFLIRSGIIDLGAFCVELSQQKNFGPNVIYFVLGTLVIVARLTYRRPKNDVYKHMSCLMVLGKTEFRSEFSVKNYVLQHWTKF